MIRIVTVFAFLFVFTGKVFSQANWVWQNPLPQGNTLNAIQSTDSRTGYAGGADGAFIKTDSSGLHWHRINFPIDANITSTDFLNDDQGWAAATMDNSVYLFQTFDGSNSWKQILKAKGGSISVDLLNSETGWASADSILYSSSDGGEHWTTRNFHQVINSVFFLNSDQGWLTAGSRVYRTNDGGENWKYATIDGDGLFRLTKIRFINSSVGYVTSTVAGPNEFSGYLYKTANGGLTWTKQLTVGVPLADYRTFTDMDFLNENTGWAVAGGNIYKTEDGKSWKQISNVSHLTRLTMVNSSTLWGAGEYGSLFISTDGGYNWHKSNGGYVTQTEDLQILNSKDIFVAGGQNLLKTTDGGKNWDLLEVGKLGNNYLDIHAVWFTSPSTGWIGVENLGGWGGLYKTADGGRTWTSQLDSLSRVFDIFFINDKTGWFFAGNKVYRTDDSGQLWNQISAISSDVEIECVYFVSDKVGYAGGYLGLFKTTDGGHSWTKINLNISDPFIHSIYFSDDQNGWATGYSGNTGLVLKTTDGGSHWNVHNLPQVSSNIYPESIRFKNRDDGWVVGHSNFGGVAFSSSDGGDTWQNVALPTNTNLSRIAFSDSTDGWILGDHGAILHYSSSAITPVGKGNGRLPGKVTLNQNYPNPFNPDTRITYTIPKDGLVQVSVYNVIGQKVAVLVHSYQRAGDHAVEFRSNDLSSGVYFYELKFNNTALFKKMLLLK